MTRAVARAHISLRANLSARAICRTHEKSYSAEKVLFIEYSSFNPSFMFTSAILDNAVYVNSVSQVLIMKAAQSGRLVLSGFFMLVFSFGNSLRTAQACTVYYFKC